MRTIVRVLDYFRPHAGRLVLVALGLGLGTFCNVYGTYLLKPVFNDHILPWIGHPDADMSGLVRILLLMGGVYLAGGAGCGARCLRGPSACPSSTSTSGPTARP